MTCRVYCRIIGRYLSIAEGEYILTNLLAGNEKKGLTTITSSCNITAYQMNTKIIDQITGDITRRNKYDG